MKITFEELAKLVNPSNSCPLKVGEKYLIRTVTHYYVGEIVEVVGNFVKLNNVSWVADTGRFSDALKSGSLSEVEPMLDGTLVSVGAIVDASPWAHALPSEQK